MILAPTLPNQFRVGHPDPRLAESLKEFPAPVFSERLYQSVELMERYSIELAVDLFHRLQLADKLTEWQSATELGAALCFNPHFCCALDWLLERLVETDCVEVRRGGGPRQYRLRHAPWQPNCDALRQTGLQIDDGNAATLDLLGYAASVYPGVARGEQTGEESLFGPGGTALWLNYFNNSNLTYAVNNWICATAAARCLTAHRRLRILELGAGAGSATVALLGALAEQGLLPLVDRYFVTEPNAFFRRRAQRELHGIAGDVKLEFGALDLNAPWQGQGAEAGEFDLVYAVNVVHVADDLLFTLAQARTTLDQGGWLVAGECMRPFPNQPIYPELMFQILESFTNVRTDSEFRPNHGFLTAEQWRCAFHHAHFAAVQVVPDTEAIREFYPHFFSGAICGQKQDDASC